MTKLTRAFCWICISLCVLFSIDAYSGKADSLFRAGAFREAAIEYERQAFAAEDAIVTTHSMLGKAACYQQMGKYSQARKLLSDIPVGNIPDSLLSRVLYRSAFCSYLAGDFGIAEGSLKLLENQQAGGGQDNEVSLLKVLVYNETHQYDKARECLINFVRNLNYPEKQKDSLLKIAESMYRPRQIPKIKKPQRAAILSVFLPGLGQTYAGYPVEGIMSLGVNLTSIGIMVLGAVHAYYLTGYVAGAGLFQKFYFGGQTRAEFLAKRHNYEVSSRFNQRIREFVLQL